MEEHGHARQSAKESLVADDLAAFKQRFDPVLGAVLRRHLAEMCATTEDPHLDEYLEYLTETFAVHGKRIRPFVLSAIYESITGHCPSAVLEYSVGVELFHTFCLIHDDIIDNSTIRHRLPTFHVEIARRMAEGGRVGDVAEIGRAQAMLVGDLLFFWAHQRLQLADGFTEEQRKAASVVVRQMVEDVVVGQMVDVDAMSRQRVSKSLVERKTMLKTAGYTFIHPMQLGVALAGGSESLMCWCAQFGEALGEAFQVMDDLLDIVGDPAKGAQARLSDIREHQHTFFTQYVFDHGTPQQGRKLNSWLGSPIAEPEIPTVAALFEETGALTAGRSRIISRLEDAKQCLKAVPDGAVASRKLSGLIDLLAARLV